jgi:hypothetical protein
MRRAEAELGMSFRGLDAGWLGGGIRALNVRRLSGTNGRPGASRRERAATLNRRAMLVHAARQSLDLGFRQI